VYNRTASKAQHLVDRGAGIVSRPIDLADRDLVFSTVSSSSDLEQVMLGDGGLLTGSAPPKIIADASTVSAQVSETIPQQLGDPVHPVRAVGYRRSQIGEHAALCATLRLESAFPLEYQTLSKSDYPLQDRHFR
jgi:hypothetical protein